MNQQTVTNIGIVILLIAVAVFGYEFTRETEMRQALSHSCCNKKQLDNFVLELNTSPCFGRCPAFSLKISSEGKLQVIGKGSVNFSEIQKELTKEQMNKIGKLVYASNFFSIQNIYGYHGTGCKSNATDHPSSSWRIAIGEDKNLINYYKGCFGAPKELGFLETELIKKLELESELL